VEEFAPVLSGGVPVGESFVRAFEVPNAEVIAIDNSANPGDPSRGDIYVSGATKREVKEGELEDKVVYKFTPTGTAPIDKLKKYKPEKGEEAEEFEPIEGIAVDSGGGVFVYDEEGIIVHYNNAEKNKISFGTKKSPATPVIESSFSSATPGLAVNSAGIFYLGHESETAGAQSIEGAPAVVGTCEVSEEECETISPELDQEVTTGVAINEADEPGNLVSERDDAYITNVDTIHGTKTTSVVAFSPSGSVIQRFGVGGPSEGDAIAVDSHTGAVYVADAASNVIDVFNLEPAGEPRVDSLSVCVSAGCGAAEGVQLQAQVDPSGADTHAFFEYGLASCATASCTSTSEVELGSGFGDRGVTANLPASLAPGLYHYRVVATNALGKVESAEKTFSITSTAPVLLDGRAWEMVSPPNKDGLEPEALLEGGAAIEASRDGSAISYVADGPFPEGAPEGNRAPEPAQILSTRGSTQWSSRDLSTAHTYAAGVNQGRAQEYQAFSPNLALALLEPFSGTKGNSQWAQPALSPPVSEHERQLKEEGKPYEEKTFYLRADTPLAPEAGNAEQETDYAAAKKNGETMNNGGYLPLVNEANALALLGGPFGGGFDSGVDVLAASSDVSHVVFRSWTASPGVYEWSMNPDPRKQLQPVTVLPKNAKGEEPFVSCECAVVGEQPLTRHAVSDSGSRVFWTLIQGTEAKLYVRDTQTHESLQLDAPMPGAGVGKPAAAFTTASADGTKVFFTDSQRLTTDSKAVQGAAPKSDLYVFELSPEGTPLSGTLRDLTPEGIHGESADVSGTPKAGGVLDTSADGSYVYFVTNGALSPGDSVGDCTVERTERAPERSCNLYMRRFNGSEWEAPRLIAVLSNDDAPDWDASGFPGNLAESSSRVSPNGRYVAFMSDRSLTGYDNTDASPAANGERDEEVFLYDASKDTLVCASCNPTGARPEGVLDPGRETESSREGEGLGLLVDRVGTWGRPELKVDHWLAGSVPGWTGVALQGTTFYQSRYLSDSGRLFFNSPDHLVPAATGTKEKVYEYEPSGLGGCSSTGGCVGLLSSPNSQSEPGGEHESAFIDASESGNDVFFVTSARLPAFNGTSADVDTSYDVYDARVCAQGGLSTCLPGPALGTAPCDEVHVPCKASAPSGPEFIVRASPSVAAPGNVAHRVVAGSKQSSKPHLTRAQLLAKALRACRSKYKGKRQKKKRSICEAKARKKYGHSSSHKHSSRHKSSHKASTSGSSA
jgi:hypothetical protein